ncbi:hypothetical protein EDB83DRAFT_2319748 [Lactarius deliciosus]|nr:hypothetical protein EDB83DRAFT_2319748 [Lactarius deliciosus]
MVGAERGRLGAIAKLQSDEPEEIAVIKMVLVQHLELDSKVTLGVLCDQVVPPDDPMEDEDKTIHERLQALVVAFLAQDPRTNPRKPLRAQLQGQRRIQILRGRRGEDRRGHSRLPALVQRGNELVLLLLTRAAEAPWEDLTPGRTPSSPQQCRGYLDLSDLLCHAKGAADLAQLLRFYCTSSLMRKMTLGRLPQDSRAFFVARLAGALAPRGHRKSPGSSKLASMGRQLVDALTIIPPTPTCHPLLTKPPPSPSPPPNTKEFVDAPPPSKRKAGGQEPGAPQEQYGTQKLSIWGQHVYQRHHSKDITSSSSPQQSMYSGASTPVEAADDGDRQQQSSTTTTMKRLKVADEDKPSLLLRMGHQCHPPVSGGRQGKSPPGAAAAALGSADACRDTRHFGWDQYQGRRMLAVASTFSTREDTGRGNLIAGRTPVGAGNKAVDWFRPRHDMQRSWAAAQRDPTHVSGFGRNMGDSPMVVVWPSRGADGEYNSVALLQLKALYEVMPTPDPHPPFAAKLSLTDTYVTMENPQIAFMRNVNPAGRDVEQHLGIQPHTGIGGLGCSHINTPQNWPRHAQPDVHPYHPRQATSPSPPSSPDIPIPKTKMIDVHDYEKAEDEGESDDDRVAAAVLRVSCTSQGVPAAPSPATIWHQFVPLPLPPVPFLFGLVGGAGLVLLYVVQYAIWSWVHRTPEESHIDMHGALLAGLDGVIILPAFFETWLGLISGQPVHTHVVGAVIYCPFPVRCWYAER